MTRTLMIAGAAIAASAPLAGAAAQDAAPESYMRFFGSVHEPVSKRTRGDAPSAFTPQGAEDAYLRSPNEDRDLRRGDFTSVAAATNLLDAALDGRRQETSMGYGAGALVGVRVSSRIAAELEVAHRTHDIEGATAENVYDANVAAFTQALTALEEGQATVGPDVVVPDAERTIAVTTVMANAAYYFPALGRARPYAAAGLGWASPAGDISDYEGNVAYQLRAGADLDLGPVLLGVQGTYVAAGDFQRSLEGPVLRADDDPTRGIEGDPGQATIEYGTAEVAVTLTVPLSR